MTDTRAAALTGPCIIRAIKEARVPFVLSVPDLTTSEGLLSPIARDPGLRLVRVCKEDEAVGIAAGLAACETRALLLIQQTGLLDSVNALRAVAVEYGQPICIMVGLLGKEPDRHPLQSRSYGVRIVVPILAAMGIVHHVIDDDRQADLIPRAIDGAYEKSEPVVLLLGRSPQP